MRPSDAVPSEFRAKATGATWASWVPLSLRSAAQGRALPRLAPAGVGAGGHAAPWGSSEVSLVISRLSSTQQHSGVGRGLRGRVQAGETRQPAKAWEIRVTGLYLGAVGKAGEGRIFHGESRPKSWSGCTQHFARDLGAAGPAVSPGWEGRKPARQPRSCLRLSEKFWFLFLMSLGFCFVSFWFWFGLFAF